MSSSPRTFPLAWWSPRFWQDIVQPEDAWQRVPGHLRPRPRDRGGAVAVAVDGDPRRRVAELWRQHAGVPGVPGVFERRWRQWRAHLPAMWRQWVDEDMEPQHVFLASGWDWGWPFTWDDQVIVWPGSDAFWQRRTVAECEDMFVHEVCHLWQRQQGVGPDVYAAWGRRGGFAPVPATWAPSRPYVRNPDGPDLWAWAEPQAASGQVVYGYMVDAQTQRPFMGDVLTGLPLAEVPGSQSRVATYGTHQLDHPHEFLLPRLVAAIQASG